VVSDFDVSLHGASTFFVTGELDIAAAPLFGDTIRAAVARGGPVTLDVSRMTFIDSAGVQAILKAVADLPSGLPRSSEDPMRQRATGQVGLTRPLRNSRTLHLSEAKRNGAHRSGLRSFSSLTVATHRRRVSGCQTFAGVPS
jgi:hypothetical protein